MGQLQGSSLRQAGKLWCFPRICLGWEVLSSQRLYLLLIEQVGYAKLWYDMQELSPAPLDVFSL